MVSAAACIRCRLIAAAPTLRVRLPQMSCCGAPRSGAHVILAWGSVRLSNHNHFAWGMQDPVLDDKKELYKFFSNLIEHDNYTFKQGDIVSGYVYEVQQRGSYVDIGAKSMAFLPNAEASLCKINRVRRAQA